MFIQIKSSFSPFKNHIFTVHHYTLENSLSCGIQCLFFATTAHPQMIFVMLSKTTIVGTLGVR